MEFTMDFITEEMFKEALPAHVRKNVNKDVLDIINTTIGDPEMIRNFRENLVGFQSVLTQGKFKLTNYVDAVKYVSHKLLGCNNITAYTRTFPDKVNDFKLRGVSDKDISAYASAFNKSKLVNLILAQSMVPTHVLNADVYQEAINVQADLMRNANSEKVRCEAANSLLVQLRPPEIKKVELDIGFKEDSAIAALRETTLQLVAQQRMALQAGAISARDAAQSGLLIEGDLDDDN
jgi:hypothetical protein